MTLLKLGWPVSLQVFPHLASDSLALICDQLVRSSSLADDTMLAATRRWFGRNRTKIAFGFGAIGGIYLAGQYAWGKWLEAQQRNAEERIAKDK